MPERTGRRHVGEAGSLKRGVMAAFKPAAIAWRIKIPLPPFAHVSDADGHNRIRMLEAS